MSLVVLKQNLCTLPNTWQTGSREYLTYWEKNDQQACTAHFMAKPICTHTHTHMQTRKHTHIDWERDTVVESKYMIIILRKLFFPRVYRVSATSPSIQRQIFYFLHNYMYLSRYLTILQFNKSPFGGRAFAHRALILWNNLWLYILDARCWDFQIQTGHLSLILSGHLSYMI